MRMERRWGWGEEGNIHNEAGGGKKGGEREQ